MMTSRKLKICNKLTNILKHIHNTGNIINSHFNESKNKIIIYDLEID